LGWWVRAGVVGVGLRTVVCHPVNEERGADARARESLFRKRERTLLCSPFVHCSMRPEGASRHTEHFRCSGTPSPSSARARTRPLLAAVARLMARARVWRAVRCELLPLCSRGGFRVLYIPKENPNPKSSTSKKSDGPRPFVSARRRTPGRPGVPLGAGARGS